MGRIDPRTVESHLVEALQHLATAAVVIRHLDRRGTLEAHDRTRLMDAALEVKAVLRQVTEDLDDRHPRGRRALPRRDTEPSQEPAHDDPAIRVIELPDLADLVDRVTNPGDDGPSEPRPPIEEPG